MHADPAALPRPSCHRRRRDTSDRLREALQQLAGGKVRIASHQERFWASITFAGARHRLELLFDGPDGVEAGELFIAELPEHEFDIPGQLVAEAVVTEADHSLLPQPRLAVSVELLLLEEA